MLTMKQHLLEIFFEVFESSAQYKRRAPKDDVLSILSGFSHIFHLVLRFVICHYYLVKQVLIYVFHHKSFRLKKTFLLMNPQISSKNEQIFLCSPELQQN